MKSYDNTLNDVAQSIKAKELAAFCGAGISIGSGIPGVVTIVEYILQKLEMESEDIRLFVDKGKNTLTIPFEMFIDQLLEASNEEAIYKLFEMFNSDHLEPNAYHCFLALLAEQGKLKTVYTTNFDCLIEKALDKKKVAYNVLHREEHFESLKESSDKFRVVKIHGCIRDKESMVSTIRRISKEELRNKRNVVVDACYSSGQHKKVMVLGYSCSDIFDITPQIEGIEKNLKEVVFIDHDKKDVKNVEPLPDKKEKNPFQRFGNGSRIYCNTDLIIKSLWKEIIEDKYPKETISKKDETWKQAVTEWLRKPISASVNGKLFLDNGEYALAIKYHQKALEILQKVRGKEHSETVMGYNNLGLAYQLKGEYDLAIQYFQKSINILERGLGRNDPALDCFFEIVIGKEHHYIVWSYSNLGLTYQLKGQYDLAVEYYTKALKVREKAFGKSHPDTAMIYDNIGVIYKLKGDYDRAIDYHEKTLNIIKEVFGQAHPKLATNYNNFGLAYQLKGRQDLAIQYFRKSLDILKKNFPQGHSYIGVVQDNLNKVVGGRV